MADILVSWIGNADIDGGRETHLAGPLVSVLKSRNFDSVYLLYNQADSNVAVLASRLEAELSVTVSLQKASLQSPIHFADIYKALDALLAEVVREHPDSPIYIQLTSGTPAMTAVSILTGKTKYRVKFLQSSLEQGVQQIDLPFDIAADFLPYVTEIQDEHLANLMAAQAPSTAAFDHIITQNPQMQRLKERAAVLAMRDVPVLIHGETGTGKEIFARAIHNSCARADKPFLCLNCGAIPAELVDSTLFGHVKGAFTGAVAAKQGVFAEADGGTLFLDEFGELPLEAQVRLLRVLQDGSFLPVGSATEQQVDVRIIAATNKNLIEEVAEGRFREDLFYRVAIGVITLPPLRERIGDIWLLAEYLMEKINNDAVGQIGYKDKNLSVGAKKVILNHLWPGNIRDLHATLLRASLWGGGDQILADDIKEAMLESPTKGELILGKDVSEGIDINDILRDVSVYYIERALTAAHGSKTKAAELLSLKNYQTLNNWMEKYGIK